MVATACGKDTAVAAKQTHWLERAHAGEGALQGGLFRVVGAPPSVHALQHGAERFRGALAGGRQTRNRVQAVAHVQACAAHAIVHQQQRCLPATPREAAFTECAPWWV